MGTCKCCQSQVNESPISSKPGIPEGLSLDTISPRLLHLAELAISNKSYTIDYINLSQKDLGEESSSIFDIILQHYTHTKVLILSSTNLGHDNWQSFSNILSSFSQLVTLDLSQNKIGSFGAEKLSCSLEKMMKLENLVLNEVGLECSGMILICGGLVNLRNLRLLSVRDNKIGDIGMRMLSNVIQHIQFLSFLDVSSNQISIVGSAYLGRCLENLRYLQVIKAGNNFFMKEGSDNVLSKLPFGIQEIFLDGVGLEDSNLSVFEPLLEKMTDLRVLVLSHNLITCKSLEILCKVLKSHKIKTLSLVACELAEGRKALSLAGPNCEILL